MIEENQLMRVRPKHVFSDSIQAIMKREKRAERHKNIERLVTNYTSVWLD